MLEIHLLDASGKVIGKFFANPKSFSTGSSGHFGSAKIEVNGKMCQVQLQAVVIGSKPATIKATNEKVVKVR